jgi:RND family efflux transporter MFP subunit
MKSQHRLCRFLLLSAIALAPLGCHGAAAAPPEEVHPAPVEAVATRALFFGDWTELLGTTQPLPNRSARISAAVDSRVRWILDDGQHPPLVEGQLIQKGQIIGKLDDSVARENRAKLDATVQSLKEQQQQAAFAVQKVSLEISRKETSLGGTPPNDVIAASLRKDLESLRIDLQDAQSKQKSAAHQYESAVADLKGLDAQLVLYELRSPIAGRLGMVQAVPGQALKVGDLVAEIVDLSAIDVLCFAPPYVAARLAVDQTARLLNGKDDDPAAPQGKVVFISVQANPDTGNFAIKVRFPNKEFAIRAGSVARTQVLTQPEKERITIPEAALLEDQQPPLVVVVEDVKVEKNKEGKDEKIGKARRLQVKVGVRSATWHVVEILGLEDPDKKETVPIEGTLFVVTGGHGLQNGDLVKLQEEEEPEGEK